MAEGSHSVEHAEEPQEECARLRLLVCELLLRNQELRAKLAAEEDSLKEL